VARPVADRRGPLPRLRPAYPVCAEVGRTTGDAPPAAPPPRLRVSSARPAFQPGTVVGRSPATPTWGQVFTLYSDVTHPRPVLDREYKVKA